LLGRVPNGHLAARLTAGHDDDVEPELGYALHVRDVETMDDLADVTAPLPVEPGDLLATEHELYRVEAVLPPAPRVAVLARRVAEITVCLTILVGAIGCGGGSENGTADVQRKHRAAAEAFAAEQELPLDEVRCADHGTLTFPELGYENEPVTRCFSGLWDGCYATKTGESITIHLNVVRGSHACSDPSG
jgi:hypothetical protein